MRSFILKQLKSFQFAFEGIRWAFSQHINFRIHFILSLIILYISYFFHIRWVEWILVVFCIILGISAEMINTAIESMTDLITKEWKKEAKIAKDVSAGMMLTVAIGTTVVAGMIFLPYFLQ